MISLNVKKNEELEAAYSLRKCEIVLGRDERCDVKLPADSVSRKHAVIREKNGSYEIADLFSANGTVVNTRCITTSKLESGDLIIIAPFTIEVSIL